MADPKDPIQEQGPLPFTPATSACGLEPALVLPTHGEMPGLFWPTWSNTLLSPTFSGAADSIFIVELEVWVVKPDGLAEGTFCGTSFLGRVIRTEEVAGKDLWEREWASGKSKPRSHPPSQKPAPE